MLYEPEMIRCSHCSREFDLRPIDRSMWRESPESGIFDNGWRWQDHHVHCDECHPIWELRHEAQARKFPSCPTCKLPLPKIASAFNTDQTLQIFYCPSCTCLLSIAVLAPGRPDDEPELAGTSHDLIEGRDDDDGTLSM